MYVCNKTCSSGSRSADVTVGCHDFSRHSSPLSSHEDVPFFPRASRVMGRAHAWVKIRNVADVIVIKAYYLPKSSWENVVSYFVLELCTFQNDVIWHVAYFLELCKLCENNDFWNISCGVITGAFNCSRSLFPRFN